MSTQSSSLNSAGFQEVEARIAGWLPAIAARVYWQEEVQVVMHLPSGNTREHNMFLLCQEKVQRADAVLLGRGATFSFKWSCYAACIFTWLTAQGMELKDVGQTNLGMRMEDVAKPCPALRLYDLLSWRRKAKPSCAWSGFQRCKPALSTTGG